MPTRAFIALLASFTLRYWKIHWLKLLLLVCIVGLGTGSFLAIGLANRAASQSFDRFSQTVSGQSDLVVTASIGSLSLDDLRSIRRALINTEAEIAPQLHANARLVNPTDSDRAFVTLIGTDLLAASNFLIRHGASNTFLDSDAPPSATNRRGFFCVPELAALQNWTIGQPVSFFLGDRIIELPFQGFLPQLDQDQPTATQVLVLDWQTLADTLEKPLSADRVDLFWMNRSAAPASIAAATTILEKQNPGHWILESLADRKQTGATMTLALRMNLRALSALSLLVAVCLVFQAMDSAVSRRQKEVATLHSLGIPKSTTRLLWLFDAGIVGALGGLVGIALGYLMAQISTEMVTQTVNTLYFKTASAPLDFSLAEASTAWLLTFVASILAGWWPASQAARSPLVETMRQGQQRSTYRRSHYIVASLSLALLSLALLYVPPFRAANGHAIPIGGYLLSLSLIGLAICLAALALESFGSLAHRLGRASSTLRLALSQFRLPVTRHRLALAGVTLSVGMTAAMILLIGSFESTVRAWIGNTLQADIFIRSKAIGSMHDQSSLSLDLYQSLANDPRISDHASIYSSSIRIQNQTTTLVGFDTAYLNRIDHTTWLKKPANLLQLQQGNFAIVNEAFASRFDATIDSSIPIPTPNGPTSFTVIGIYADYGNENGSIGIDQKNYRSLTGETAPRAIALHLAEPETAADIANELSASYPALQVMTNRWLREETLRIFNRVFSITYALEAIGLIISVAGLASMLASLLFERRAQISALTRIGYSRQQNATSALWEGLALAILGLIAGLILGFALGLVLVFIINRQSFGWTLALACPWGQLATLALLILTASAPVAYLIGKHSATRPIINEE